MPPVLEVTELTKMFGTLTAVNHINFQVNKGEIFGILGPNGSGKTTTLSMILSLLRPTTGSIRMFGSTNSEAERSRWGVSLETAGFFPKLTAIQNLRIVASIKNVHSSNINYALKKVDLSSVSNKQYKTFSQGMKQRLAIASALLGNPEVLVLDEPTNGLDPLGVIDIRNLILDLSKDGKTIIIASHLLAEMEKICSHIVILNKGKLIKEGTLADFMTEYQNLENAFIHLCQA